MYNFRETEQKWGKYWEDNNTFKTDVWDFSKPKFYALDMFPYPSGAGLHTGHAEGYTATDIISRMKRMQGFNVLHPMGFDAFGLPAEQYAISTGNHPDIFTNSNIEIFKKQLKELGFSYDWNLQLSTCDPAYYKWTQWIFTELYKKGLVKNIDMPVNWCEELGTVLANDEVIDGKSERGGYPVIKKNMRQCVIDIPKYADKLLEGLEDLDWPNSTKEMQRNWIGKSYGAHVNFKVSQTDYEFTVFTTRADTLFGATYCVLAPENELVKLITTNDQKEEIDKYIKDCSKKSEIERTDGNIEKTGAFTGSYAINPVNNKLIPIWISDYVLNNYGTGAIMAVPAHDKRDYDFAKKYNLEIIHVLDSDNQEEYFVGDGVHINSGFLDGMNKEDAINKMIEFLEENNIGTKKVNYHIREWVFARQRYWGEPIPLVYDENNNEEVLELNELPLVLPELEDYAPSKSGASPLERATDWVNIIRNGKKVKREISTMPGSAGSSWYFLRYIDPHNDKEFANQELLKHWLPVDLYVGGPEHAVGHLLYSRMWNRFLYDEGLSPVKEPFKKLVHQGMILGENNIKMGKRFPEYCINPSDVIHEYGADTLRLYEMFMGPLEADKPWSKQGVDGAKRFLDRVHRLYCDNVIRIVDEPNKNLDKIFNQTVKKVTDDYESLAINTAISQLMIFINAVYKEEVFPLKYAIDFLKLLNPIAPFITEELYEILGHNESIALSNWPIYNEDMLIDETFELVVQVNGKVRGKIEVNSNTTEDEMKEAAKNIENVKKYLENAEILKVVVVPKKLVSIVIK